MGISDDDARDFLRIMRRNAEGLNDNLQNYTAQSSRGALERIIATSDRMAKAAAALQELHA